MIFLWVLFKISCNLYGSYLLTLASSISMTVVMYPLTDNEIIVNVYYMLDSLLGTENIN